MKIQMPCTPIVEAEFDMQAIAGWLAGQPDVIQAAFFNEFDVQLRRTCEINGGSTSMQCLFISENLTTDAAYTLQDLSNVSETSKYKLLEGSIRKKLKEEQENRLESAAERLRHEREGF